MTPYIMNMKIHSYVFIIKEKNNNKENELQMVFILYFCIYVKVLLTF